ncbi:MAG TPA: DUF6531 domain-containing protein [Candidatus Angelobacter sp.]|nr:DUF6531 domain-containing protein [Candidatus Angelobacter sp.]
MICPYCNTQLPPQQQFCPHCGTFDSAASGAQRSFGSRHPALLVVACLAVMISVCSFGAVLLFKRIIREVHPKDTAVVHGAVASPAELNAHGRLYFLPLGRQVIPAETLAGYYQQKFNIQIEVLPVVEPNSASYYPDRKQYAAEDLIADMKLDHPELARDPNAVVIGLTDEDIFQRWLGGSNFTYSYHAGYQFGIVSTRRMDPAFWGDPPSDSVRLASTKQMLTKYVAFMYFHVPVSDDRTSVMRQPLTPDGGSDNLYESDLHSEESDNGLEGNGWPCISYIYSYSTQQMTPVSPDPTDCNLTKAPQSSDEEIFAVELGLGRFMTHGMDMKLDSTPPIEYRRSYLSDYARQRSLGWGTDVSFNTSLISDGPSALTYIEIVREDASRDRVERVSPGRGFSANVAFEGENAFDGAYRARMTWERDHFKIQYPDGSSATYLPCNDYRCFWTGSQDAAGNKLTIQRDPALGLLQVLSQDRQGISFQPDDQHRIAEAYDTASNTVKYEYDADGCLARVHRPDGRVIVYEYDGRHHMTRVSVINAPGEEPQTLVKNEYDPTGHITKETLADGSQYEIKYQAFAGRHASQLTVREPSGRLLHFALTDQDYHEWTTPIRFPRVPSQ